MFLRMVTHTYRDNEVLQMAGTYERSVLPALRSTPGCIFAAFIQNIEDSHDCISLTLWNSPDEAREYESSGRYLQLVDEMRPFFTEPAEWRLQLNADNALENVAVPVEPEVVQFSDPVAGSEELSRLKPKPYAVQIVTLTVQEEHLRDFEKIFLSEIRRKYAASKGFIDLILLRRNRVYFGISFWDETADVTASSDLQSRDDLARSIYSVLPSYVQWRMSHSSDAVLTSASSEDVRASVYRCLTAEWFAQ